MGNKLVEQECLNAILTYQTNDESFCSLQRFLIKNNLQSSEQPDFVCAGDKMVIGLEHFRYDMLCDSKGQSLHGKEFSAFNKAQKKSEAERTEMLQKVIQEQCNGVFNFNIETSVASFLKCACSHNDKIDKYRNNLLNIYGEKEIAIFAIVDMYCVRIPWLQPKDAYLFLQSFLDGCHKGLDNFDGFIICAHDYKGYQNVLCAYGSIQEPVEI